MAAPIFLIWQSIVIGKSGVHQKVWSIINVHMNNQNPNSTVRTSSPWRAIISVFATLLVLVLIFFGATLFTDPLRAGGGQVV